MSCLVGSFTLRTTTRQHTSSCNQNKMRQLKGKVKETRKQKKERKMENVQMREKIGTIVLPALGAIALMIVAFIYLKTRPAILA
ncbi:hypothetical protein ACLKA7_015663 [Drosophila subpalustris]